VLFNEEVITENLGMYSSKKPTNSILLLMILLYGHSVVICCPSNYGLYCSW